MSPLTTKRLDSAQGGTLCSAPSHRPRGVAHTNWLRCLSELPGDEALEELRPLHWGELKPLFDIVAIIARHHVYHAGEINQLLSIARGEAWEEYEEVEENHVSTVGHRVRPPWLPQSS